MKLSTTCIIERDGKKCYAVVELGRLGVPVGVFGPAEGRSSAKSKAQAEFYADAPVMMDVLEAVVWELGNFNPNFPMAPGKYTEFKRIIERATKLVEKHGGADCTVKGIVC